MKSFPSLPLRVSARLVPKHWTSAWQAIVAARATPLKTTSASSVAANNTPVLLIIFRVVVIFSTPLSVGCLMSTRSKAGSALRGIGQRYEDCLVLRYEEFSSTKVLER